MENKAITIDLPRLFRFMFKRFWMLILMFAICTAGLFWYQNKSWVPTYTASASIYVVNSNPNLYNYEYVSTSDLNAGTQLLDTYMVVIQSNTVMNKVLEFLAQDPELSGWVLTKDYVSRSLDMGSVNKTGVMKIYCTTTDPVLSREICNTVVDVAPEEIKRVVGAGSVEVVDYATLPKGPDAKGSFKKTLLGGIAGTMLAFAVLFVVFMLDRRVKDERELEEKIPEVPILATILRMDEPGSKSKRRRRKKKKQPSVQNSRFLINEKSGDTITESYKTLRTNLRFAMIKGDHKLVVVTSSMPNEGKSTITANLGIVLAQDHQRVLLIDGDMRRPSQHRIFETGEHRKGLSTALLGSVDVEDAIVRNVRPGLDFLPVGLIPPNPSEMMNSDAMRDLIARMEKEYDIILLDVPPVNAVTDALVLSDIMSGLLFVVRERFSDYREINKALTAIRYTDANLLGFVMSGLEMNRRSYYQRKYYHRYYQKYYGQYRRTSTDSAKMKSDWLSAIRESNERVETKKTKNQSAGTHSKGHSSGREGE